MKQSANKNSGFRRKQQKQSLMQLLKCITHNVSVRSWTSARISSVQLENL